MYPTNKKRRERRSIGTIGALAGLPLAAMGGWIGYSALCIPHALPLPEALLGERRLVNGRSGQVSYYVAGSGRPLLLIHSINAAASAYEMRPLFERYRHSRRVYAVDLPGFGFSDRSPQNYSIGLYTNALLDMVDEIRRDGSESPIDAMALSLGAEFLARAASERPNQFQTLALITPTGFNTNARRAGDPATPRGAPLVRDVLSFPLWSRAFFDLLNTRASQQYFLAKTFGSAETIDQGLLEYAYLTAHQPDAQHAPYAFVSGLLFSADIDRIYGMLNMPIWMPHGTRGDFSDFSAVGNVATKANWTIQPFQTGAIPYFEQPEAFFAAYDQFLEQTQQ